jgi:hypothetical protein
MRHAQAWYGTLPPLVLGAFGLGLVQAFVGGLFPGIGLSLSLVTACLLRLCLSAERLMLLILPAFLMEAVLQGGSPVGALVVAAAVLGASGVATAAPFLPSRMGAAALLCCAAMVVAVPDLGAVRAFGRAIFHWALASGCLIAAALIAARWPSREGWRRVVVSA